MKRKFAKWLSPWSLKMKSALETQPKIKIGVLRKERDAKLRVYFIEQSTFLCNAPVVIESENETLFSA